MEIAALRAPESKFAGIGIALGFFVSCILALADGLFLPNFEFYWGSQLAVIVIIFLLRPRPAIIGVLSVYLAVMLIGFNAWLGIRSNLNADGGVWFLYLVLLVGATAGCVIAIYWLRKKKTFSSFQAASVVAATAIGGSTLSMIMGCYSVFYCH